MPEDRSPPQEAGNEIKPPNKHKWRGKLFSTEGRIGKGGGLESTDDDVATFLQATAAKPKARPQPGQLAPRIDTAAAPRFPAAAIIPESSTIIDAYRRPKPRQNKGLHVSFQTTPPEIIGEGGDEAELPSREVSKSSQLAPQSGQTWTGGITTDAHDGMARSGRRRSPVPAEDPTFEPKILQRTPTGLSEIFHDKVSNDYDQDAEISSLSTTASPPSKRKPLPQPPQTQYQEDLGSESGSNDPSPDISPVNGPANDSDESFPGQVGGKTSHWMPKFVDPPSSETLAGNSITPRPSPQPPSEHSKVQSADYHFPSVEPSIHSATEPAASRNISTDQVSSESPAISANKAFSLRRIAKGFADDSLDDFDARVRRFNNLFWLGVSAHIEPMRVPFVQWIRTACWWFLKGRQGLETEVRSKSDMNSHSELSPTLKQAYVNLAKAWWIVKDITPNHPQVTKFGKANMNSLCAMIKNFGDQVLAEQAGIHIHIIANMRALSMSMRRNGMLPPLDLEIQRLDLHVLLELPQIQPDIARIMVNNNPEKRAEGRPMITQPFFPIPIGDTERHFNFGRMFIEISKVLDDPHQDLHVPCILTVLRERSEWGVLAAIASQNGQVNLVISDEMANAFTWKSVQWQIKSHEVILATSRDLEMQLKLRIQFAEKDFKTLWGICDYTQKTRKKFSAHKEEELIFERTLRKFQCDDAAHFPANAIDGCKIRVFEKKRALSERSIDRTIHNGYRLTVITPPKIKTLSVVSYDLGRENPIVFGIYKGDDHSRLILRILPPSVKMSLDFAEEDDNDTFHHLLQGTLVTKEDHCLSSLELQNLEIHGKSSNEDIVGFGNSHHTRKLPWTKVRIVSKGPRSSGRESMPIKRDNLRIIADSEFGTLTDRIHLTAGELQLGLSHESFNELKLLRPPQTDMTWSLADQKTPKEGIKSVTTSLNDMLTSPTTRTYHFRLLQDLHSFQASVTGFSVLFDGLASIFAISRRRMVIPSHKKWEATSARLQIVKHDKSFQLIGFFGDFNYGTCINFVLKLTDVFEIFSKTGLSFLRIVDAKFPLPKNPDDESRDFVCLDTPEYPSEHDDITIGFDNEHGMVKPSRALMHELLTPLQIEIVLQKRCLPL